MEVEVASRAPVSNKPTVSVDVKRQHSTRRASSEPRICVKVEVDVLGSPYGLCGC